MSRPLKVLVVEDNPLDAELTLRALRHSGFEPASEIVSTAAAMREALDRKSWDLVISDHGMPGFSAPAALVLLKSRAIDVPFIIVTGTMGEELAVEAMRAGAHDYLVKGRLARLGAAVERELREAQVRRAKRDAEGQLRRAEERYRTLVEQIPAVTYIATADATRATIYISPQIGSVTGHPPEDWIGADRWLSRVHPEDRARVQEELGRCFESDAGFTSEYRLIGRDERVVWVHDEAAVVRENESGPLYLRGFVIDITAARESEETIRRMAYQDTLTGLPNALGLAERLNELVEEGRRATRPFGLLIIGVQGMGEVNCTLGRSAGDQLLRQIANRLLERERAGITIARVGGHELAATVPGADADHGMRVAREIAADFQRPFDIEGVTHMVRVQIGVAVFPDHGEDPELLLKRAEIAASVARCSGTVCETFTAEKDPYTAGRLVPVG